jgi:metal-dependent hydrolase (beta-lactamase superfamily II)
MIIRNGSKTGLLTEESTADQRRVTAHDQPDAPIGGFHLNGPLFEPIIADTVSALEQLAPEVVVPAHCTGWKATHAIATRLPAPSSRTASAPPSAWPPRPVT